MKMQNKLWGIIFSCLVMFSSVLYADFSSSSVDVGITAVLNKFAVMSLDTSGGGNNWSFVIDQTNGSYGKILGATKTVATLSALSNSKGGYKVSVVSANGFKLKNSDSSPVEINYSLVLDKTGQGVYQGNGTVVTPTLSSTGDLLSITGVTQSVDNKINGASIKLTYADQNDVVITDSQFADTITLTIALN